MDKWKLGSYTFAVNPSKYGENYELIGDTVTTLNGTVISQPSTIKESYSFEGIFFQYRERIMSEVSIGNADFIEYVNGSFYTFDKTSKKVSKFSSSLSLQSQVTLATSNERGFDFDGTYYWIIEENAPNQLKKFSSAGVLSQTITISGVTPKGLSIFGGYAWILGSNSKLYKYELSLGAQIAYADLPTIPSSETAYVGMTEQNGYLVIAYNYDDFIGAYHLDTTNGTVVNQFSIPVSRDSLDVAYDGKNYVFLGDDDIVRYTNGNTILLDIYNLEKEIKTKGYLDMVDDMGVVRRVFIEDYEIQRLEGNIHKYNVSISATKVNRGVN